MTDGAADDGLPPLRDVIARFGLDARKQLGQNFLLDLNLTGRIARTAGVTDRDHVLEIGPGPGGLTRALLASGAAKVTVVERDERCLPALAQISDAYPGRLEVIHDDALRIDPVTILERPGKIVANLPYNIATPLVIGWLKSASWPPVYGSMTLMFQREVADRLTSPAGKKSYGRLSILTQWRWHAERCFDVDPRAFTPSPKVVSSIVRFTPRDSYDAEVETASLERVTAAAFGQRRKMLRTSLKSLGVPVEQLLQMSNIDPQVRPESLDIASFCRLAKSLNALEGQGRVA